jgi:hypothetical protein
VKHRAAKRFWSCHEALPQSVRQTADKCFVLLKEDPDYPSLHFKKVGKYWSIGIGAAYRALAVSDGMDFIWVWIGNHDEYEDMIRRH